MRNNRTNSDSAVNTSTSETGAQTAIARVSLRAVRANDAPAVLAFLARHGHPARSEAGWRWALIDNPTRAAPGAEAGWVLESKGCIVGFLGNLPLRYLQDGLAVWGASCTVPVVDADARAHGVRLLRAFAAQPGAALVCALPSSEPLEQVFARLGFEPLGCDSAASERLRWHLGKSRPWLDALRHGPLQRMKTWAQRRKNALEDQAQDPASPSYKVLRLSADELQGTCPSHWPQTWNEWANRYWSRPGLWAERSAYLMSWRLSDPDAGSKLGLWAVLDGNDHMLGMAMARLRPAAVDDGARAELLDWALLPQAPVTAGHTLLLEVQKWALTQAALSVDAAGFSGEALGQLRALQPSVLGSCYADAWVLNRSELGAHPKQNLPAWSSPGIELGSWFMTDLTDAPVNAPAWHPARAAGLRPAATVSAAPTSNALTSSACASQ